jgi:hypothetical protein
VDLSWLGVHANRTLALAGWCLWFLRFNRTCQPVHLSATVTTSWSGCPVGFFSQLTWSRLRPQLLLSSLLCFGGSMLYASDWIEDYPLNAVSFMVRDTCNDLQRCRTSACGPNTCF